MAMLRTFIESGCRLGEVAGPKVEDVDFEEDVVYVVGKGRRPRRVAFGAKTGQALDKYLRLRSRHPQASSPTLWLGQGGHDGERHSPDTRAPVRTGGHGQGPSLPVPPHRSSHLACRREVRGVCDAELRLAQPHDVVPVRSQRG